MLVRHECPGKRVLKWLLFCDHYHISFPRGNFPSKSLPELLGRLVRSTAQRNPFGKRADEVSFRMCSKVQVAYKSWISVAPFPRVYLVYSNEHDCAAALVILMRGQGKKFKNFQNFDRECNRTFQFLLSSSQIVLITIARRSRWTRDGIPCWKNFKYFFYEFQFNTRIRGSPWSSRTNFSNFNGGQSRWWW